MGFKSKVLGIFAAAAMTLSVIAGAGANTVNTPASVTLTGGQCTVAVSKSSFNFGTWKYDGATSTYIWQNNHAKSHDVVWTFTEGTPKGCDATLTFDGLHNATTGQTIGLENFTGTMVVNVPGASIPIGPVELDNTFMDLGNGFSNTSNSLVAGWLEGNTGDPTFPTSTIDGNITLTKVPADTDLGLYTGTVKSEINNAP